MLTSPSGHSPWIVEFIIHGELPKHSAEGCVTQLWIGAIESRYVTHVYSQGQGYYQEGSSLVPSSCAITTRRLPFLEQERDLPAA